jgi:hypothetical protein
MLGKNKKIFLTPWPARSNASAKIFIIDKTSPPASLPPDDPQCTLAITYPP